MAGDAVIIAGKPSIGWDIDYQETTCSQVSRRCDNKRSIVGNMFDDVQKKNSIIAAQQ